MTLPLEQHIKQPLAYYKLLFYCVGYGRAGFKLNTKKNTKLFFHQTTAMSLCMHFVLLIQRLGW